jgi:hypothetical protein
MTEPDRRHGYAMYAVLGALTGGMFAYASQVGGLMSIPVGVVVGALFGLAVRDAL